MITNITNDSPSPLPTGRQAIPLPAQVRGGFTPLESFVVRSGNNVLFEFPLKVEDFLTGFTLNGFSVNSFKENNGKDHHPRSQGS